MRSGFPLIGENRVQELVSKAPELDELLDGTPFVRHFIGRLQSNKIGAMLPLVSCVQSVHSAELAGKLAHHADDAGRRLEVMVQVMTQPALELRGLMTIGLNDPDRGAVRAGYLRLAELSAEIRKLPGAVGADALSMGMSGDFELAIAAGATVVRIGSAAFGARAPAG